MVDWVMIMIENRIYSIIKVSETWNNWLWSEISDRCQVHVVVMDIHAACEFSVTQAKHEDLTSSIDSFNVLLSHAEKANYTQTQTLKSHTITATVSVTMTLTIDNSIWIFYYIARQVSVFRNIIIIYFKNNWWSFPNLPGRDAQGKCGWYQATSDNEAGQGAYWLPNGSFMIHGLHDFGWFWFDVFEFSLV